MFSIHDRSKNNPRLKGFLRKRGYDWWWHNFTAVSDTTGEERQFFVEFFTVNPGLGGPEPLFGLGKDGNRGHKPSYLMVKCGAWGEGKAQLHRFFPWDKVSLWSDDNGYHVEAGDCFAEEDHLIGSVSITEEEEKAHPEWMCDSGSMSFDLRIHKVIPFNVGYGTSKLFLGLEAFQMYWHAEGMKSLFSGKVVFNGEPYTVKEESSYGYADKNWGRGYTSPWVWLSTSSLVRKDTGERLENSVFDIGGGNPTVYFVPLGRKLLGVLYLEGKEYDFNFSHFWLGTKTLFRFEETEEKCIWHVEQRNRKAKMVTDVTCLKKDMIKVNYEDPDGQKKHNNLWNGGNGKGHVTLYEKKGKDWILVEELEADRIGCEYGEEDR